MPGSFDEDSFDQDFLPQPKDQPSSVFGGAFSGFPEYIPIGSQTLDELVTSGNELEEQMRADMRLDDRKRDKGLYRKIDVARRRLAVRSFAPGSDMDGAFQSYHRAIDLVSGEEKYTAAVMFESFCLQKVLEISGCEDLTDNIRKARLRLAPYPALMKLSREEFSANTWAELSGITTSSSYPAPGGRAAWDHMRSRVENPAIVDEELQKDQATALTAILLESAIRAGRDTSMVDAPNASKEVRKALSESKFTFVASGTDLSFLEGAKLNGLWKLDRELEEGEGYEDKKFAEGLGSSRTVSALQASLTTPPSFERSYEKFRASHFRTRVIFAMKGGEMKVRGRLFAMFDRDSRTVFNRVGRFCGRILGSSPHATKGSDSDKIKALCCGMTKGSRAISSLDFSGWNLGFTRQNSSLECAVMSDALGEPGLLELMHERIRGSSSMFRVADEPNKVLRADRHDGGVEGQLQEVWELFTNARIMSWSWRSGRKAVNFGQGDNQVVLSDSGDCDDLCEYLSLRGMKAKPEEVSTWVGGMVYQRMAFARGVCYEQAAKQVVSAFVPSARGEDRLSRFSKLNATMTMLSRTGRLSPAKTLEVHRRMESTLASLMGSEVPVEKLTSPSAIDGGVTGRLSPYYPAAALKSLGEAMGRTGGWRVTGAIENPLMMFSRGIRAAVARGYIPLGKFSTIVQLTAEKEEPATDPLNHHVTSFGLRAVKNSVTRALSSSWAIMKMAATYTGTYALPTGEEIDEAEGKCTVEKVSSEEPIGEVLAVRERIPGEPSVLRWVRGERRKAWELWEEFFGKGGLGRHATRAAELAMRVSEDDVYDYLCKSYSINPGRGEFTLPIDVIAAESVKLPFPEDLMRKYLVVRESGETFIPRPGLHYVDTLAMACAISHHLSGEGLPSRVPTLTERNRLPSPKMTVEMPWETRTPRNQGDPRLAVKLSTLEGSPEGLRLLFRLIGPSQVGEIGKLIRKDDEFVAAKICNCFTQGEEIAMWEADETHRLDIADPVIMAGFLKPYAWGGKIPQLYGPEEFVKRFAVRFSRLSMIGRRLYGGRDLPAELYEGKRLWPLKTSSMVPLEEFEIHGTLGTEDKKFDKTQVHGRAYDAVAGGGSAGLMSLIRASEYASVRGETPAAQFRSTATGPLGPSFSRVSRELMEARSLLSLYVLRYQVNRNYTLGFRVDEEDVFTRLPSRLIQKITELLDQKELVPVSEIEDRELRCFLNGDLLLWVDKDGSEVPVRRPEQEGFEGRLLFDLSQMRGLDPVEYMIDARPPRRFDVLTPSDPWATSLVISWLCSYGQVREVPKVNPFASSTMVQVDNFSGWSRLVSSPGRALGSSSDLDPLRDSENRIDTWLGRYTVTPPWIARNKRRISRCEGDHGQVHREGYVKRVCHVDLSPVSGVKFEDDTVVIHSRTPDRSNVWYKTHYDHVTDLPYDLILSAMRATGRRSLCFHPKGSESVRCAHFHLHKEGTRESCSLAELTSTGVLILEGTEIARYAEESILPEGDDDLEEEVDGLGAQIDNRREMSDLEPEGWPPAEEDEESWGAYGGDEGDDLDPPASTFVPQNLPVSRTLTEWLSELSRRGVTPTHVVRFNDDFLIDRRTDRRSNLWFFRAHRNVVDVPDGELISAMDFIGQSRACFHSPAHASIGFAHIHIHENRDRNCRSIDNDGYGLSLRRTV